MLIIFTSIFQILVGLLFLIHTIVTRDKIITTLSFTKEVPIEPSQRKIFLRVKNYFGISQTIFFIILSIITLRYFDEISRFLFPMLLADLAYSLYIQKKLTNLTLK